MGNGVRGEAPAKFLKVNFTPFPDLVGDSRLRFWVPLTEIFLVVKFGPDRAPAGGCTVLPPHSLNRDFKMLHLIP